MISLARIQYALICTLALLQCIYGSGSTPPPSTELAKELMDYYSTNNPNKTIYSQLNHRRMSKTLAATFDSDAPIDSSSEPMYGNIEKPGKKSAYSEDNLYDNVMIHNRPSTSAPPVPPRNNKKRGTSLAGNSAVSVDSLLDPTYAVLDFSKMKRHKGVSNLDADTISTSSFEYIDPKQFSASHSPTSDIHRRFSTDTFDALDYPYNSNFRLSFQSNDDADSRGYDEGPNTRHSNMIRNTRDSLKSTKKGAVAAQPPPKPKRTFEHKVQNKKHDMFHPKNYTRENADVVEMSSQDARFPERKRDKFLKKFMPSRKNKSKPVQHRYSDRQPAIEPYVEDDSPFDIPYGNHPENRSNVFKRVFTSNDKRQPPPQIPYDEIDGQSTGEAHRNRLRETFLRLRPNSSDSDSSNA